MASRLVYFTPKGPLCFIDYLTVTDGQEVLEQIKDAFKGPRMPKLYEFRLFEKLRNGLVRLDNIELPRLDLRILSIFLDSLNKQPLQLV